MRLATITILASLLFFSAPLLGQGRRLWVLQPPGEMVEYDPGTFAVKQKVQVPPEVLQSPERLRINHVGQILFATPVPLPLAEEDVASAHKVWFWNGHTATTIDPGVTREVSTTGSNQAVSETSSVPFLSADGGHLFWFLNRARRLQRDNVDLSVSATWQVWQTDLSGAGRDDLVTEKFPECRCATGTCEETCAYGAFWAPDDGVGKLFLMTEFVAGQTEPQYKKSSLYVEQSGKWVTNSLPEPLLRVLDAGPSGDPIVEAIPDSGCCGWSNQSNDQTLVLGNGKKRTIFDEQATYKNSDYDVSFYTSNARLSPDSRYVAVTINSTAESNKPIQLAEQGEANPEELQHIRKALTELPVVEVKTIDDDPRRVAYVPHAVLVGWLNEKDLLIVEDHVLVVYTVATGARHKSSIRVEDAARVFLR